MREQKLYFQLKAMKSSDFQSLQVYTYKELTIKKANFGTKIKQ